MKIINVAIIGQGRSGRDIHGKFLLTDPKHYRIVAATDLLPDRRERAAREYNCAVYKDYHDLFKRTDIDLIVNTSFSPLHAPISLEILKAGFNVLCEKPLASRVRDVDQLIAAAKKSRKVLAIFQQSRYLPSFVKVREVIDSGVLGRIVQISIAYSGFSRRWDWQTLQSSNGGNLLNTGPHPLDQALTLFGNDMPEVRCFMDRANTWGDAEDYVKLILSGKGHPVIDIEISSCSAYPPVNYNVYGTHGGMKASFDDAEWKYFKPSEAPKQKLIVAPLHDKNGLPAYCGETLKWHTGKWPAESAADNKSAYVPGAPKADRTAALYGMLYKTLTKKAPLEITPEQIRRQIAVIEECQRQNPHIYRKRKDAKRK